MADPCPESFDRSRLTGALDEALTQQEEQRVRIHLERCGACRAAYDELAALREVTMSTRFVEPSDSGLGERPRGAFSLGVRGLGWLLAAAWLAVSAGYGFWQAWQGRENAFGRFLAFGGLGGALLLLLSVVVDRVRESRTDRYREVKR